MRVERLKVYCRDRCRGEATLEKTEGRAEISVTMDDPGDGLYRAALVGTGGQLTLGVLEPTGGTLFLRRRPYLRDVERLGDLRCIQADCSFHFRKKKLWQKTEAPASLVENAFLRERLIDISGAWWHREQGMLTLALPLLDGRPFPLEALFCFGTIRCVEGQWCVVYHFDEKELPICGN